MRFSSSVNTIRFLMTCAGIFGAYAVLFGAWSSHGLEVDSQAQNWATIAVRYMSWHVVALFALSIVGYLGLKLNHPLPVISLIGGILWSIAIFLFSGSLSIMAITDDRSLAVLTPIGGIAFASGWLCQIIAALKLK